METEVSLPCSQEPATCSYTEPDRSNPCPHSTSLKSILILSSHIRLSLPSASFPRASPLKSCMHLSSSPYVLHAPSISVLYHTLRVITYLTLKTVFVSLRPFLQTYNWSVTHVCLRTGLCKNITWRNVSERALIKLPGMSHAVLINL
jgi:hypothetical protein